MKLSDSDIRVIHSKDRYRVYLLSAVALWGLFSGCGDGVRRPSATPLGEFENAGRAGPEVDLSGVVRAQRNGAAYRVAVDEVIQIQIPQILVRESPAPAGVEEAVRTCTCRVATDGMIELPIVGSLAVVGKSMSEIESAVAGAYYPQYTSVEPAIHASVLEYRTCRVSIVGTVVRPGVYALRRDQMSLVALLMEAGGIAERGAAVIRIARADPQNVQPAGQAGLAVDAAGWLSESRAGAWKAIGAQRIAASAPLRRIDPEVTQLAFRREGPLCTTGWLRLEANDQVLGPSWLDLGNRSLRQAFLRRAVLNAGTHTAAEMDAALARLAGVLEGALPGSDVQTLARHAGWQTENAVDFVMSLPGSLRDDRNGLVAPVVVRGTEGAEENRQMTVALPVKGLNIPFSDVVLADGDAVVVEAPQEQYVSVVGLVARAGNFPYPPTAHYTLVQAIALAGGLDLVADPRYVSVYRLKPDGSIASTTVQLVNPRNRENLTRALALPLRPGDVVSVEHTPRTRTNVFLNTIFRISLGLYFSPSELWSNGGE